VTSNVICISRTLAAGAEEIGSLVATNLGFRYLDREIIIGAADQAGVPPEAIEQTEHSPGFVGRILEALTLVPASEAGYAGLPAGPLPRYEKLIRQVVREAASQRRAVIVAHGASMELAGSTDLLRVLITASPDVRAERLVRSAGVSLDEADKAIGESDRQRRDYLRRFFNIAEELPTHYDIVLNTDTMSAPTAAQLIVAAAT